MNYAWWTMYIIDLNPAELKYPLRISIDKCNGIYDVLSPKICLSKEAKDKFLRI